MVGNENIVIIEKFLGRKNIKFNINYKGGFNINKNN